MDAAQFTTPMTPCGSPLPELEVPIVNTMARCLGSQNRKLDGLSCSWFSPPRGSPVIPRRLQRIYGLSRYGTRSGAIYGRICNRTRVGAFVGRSAPRNFRWVARYAEKGTSRDPRVGGRFVCVVVESRS